MTATATAPAPPDTADATSAARIVVGAALVGAGLVHLVYAGPHLAESTSHGMFFLVVAWLQLGLGVLFATGRGGRGVLLSAAILNVAVIAVWAVSRTVGIGGEVEPMAFPDTLATVLEAVGAAGCVRIALSPRGWFPISPATQGAVTGASVTAVALLVSASLVPALAGTHDHAPGHAHNAESAASHDHDAGATHTHDDGTTGSSHAGAGHAHDAVSDDAASGSAAAHHHEDSPGAAALASGAGAAHDHTGAGAGTTPHDHDPGAGSGTTVPTGHDHTTPPAGSGQTDGHDHGTGTGTGSGSGTGTGSDDHDHGSGTGTGSTDDWETVRHAALIGGASEATQATVKDTSAVFLAEKIRTLSGALKKLPADEREARIAMFVRWTIDHAVDSEHGGNHTHGPATWTPLGAADTVALQQQLKTAAAVIAKYPTAADAMAAGYMMVTPWVPGIGAHYLNAAYVDRFDAAKPSMLLYNGNAPSSVLVGVSYALHVDPTPAGFTGPNDVWHEHPQLCLVGAFVAGGDNTPADLCSMIGGSKGNGFGGGHLWMMHLWQVPGWESPWGLFSGENPSLNLATTDLGSSPAQ